MKVLSEKRFQVKGSSIGKFSSVQEFRNYKKTEEVTCPIEKMIKDMVEMDNGSKYGYGDDFNKLLDGSVLVDRDHCSNAKYTGMLEFDPETKEPFNLDLGTSPLTSPSYKYHFNKDAESYYYSTDKNYCEGMEAFHKKTEVTVSKGSGNISYHEILEEL